MKQTPPFKHLIFSILLTLTTADTKTHTLRLLKQSDIFGQ